MSSGLTYVYLEFFKKGGQAEKNIWGDVGQILSKFDENCKSTDFQSSTNPNLKKHEENCTKIAQNQ